MHETSVTALDQIPTRPAPSRVGIAIVGAGFSGIGLAIHLKQSGFGNFVVFERGDEVGGTWNYNTYPGCGCDVPSHLYSFSFAPNPNWSRTYSKQPEILDYLRDCVDRFGIANHFRLQHTVLGAQWNDEQRLWHIDTDRGRVEARVLIVAMGPLTEPHIPELPGLDSFEGTVFHSARWNHDYDLAGKQVASIGTGASAIQYVPAIAGEVARLHVVQRTPPWIWVHTDRPITALEQRIYRRFPIAQRLVRAAVFAQRELFVLGFVKNPRLMKLGEAIARRHRRRQLRDRELQRRVTPDYAMGCKRILPSNNWYPALLRPNVELVTAGIDEIRAHSIVTTDGVERDVDTIIFGTGFYVTDSPAAHQVRGRDGRTLAEHFPGAPRAYLGTAFADFPNLFMLLGPNTGLGHTSEVYMIESQLNYVMDALRYMDENDLQTMEVEEPTLQSFNRDIDLKSQGTVWNTGCSSWYLDATGRNPTIWPDWTWRFRRRAKRFDPATYVRTGNGSPRSSVPLR